MNRRLSITRNACLSVLLGASLAFAQAALDKRTSLDVNAVPPADVFGSLAQTLGCSMEIDPAVKTPVTIRLSNITVRTALGAICESIGCSWRLAGKTLHIDAAPFQRPSPLKPDALRGILDAKTPADFKFENAPLKTVLEALGKVGGLEIGAEEPEASRPLTIDLSNRSIMAALQEIGKSGELQMGMYVAVSKMPDSRIRIKFVPRGESKGAARPKEKPKAE